jgi:hypothetical protein
VVVARAAPACLDYRSERGAHVVASAVKKPVIRDRHEEFARFASLGHGSPYCATKVISSHTYNYF